MKTDVLVIGGSAAGIMAAGTASKHYPDKKITLVRKEEKVLIPCGIPYTMATVDGPENNLIPDKAVTGKGVELIIDTVVGVNSEQKTAQLKSDTEVKYDKLIIATGSKPSRPPIKGLEKDGVYTVRKDFELLKEMREKLSEIDDLLIIGGGFIGIEFADECRKRENVNVRVVELLDHVLAAVCDEEYCIKAEERLEDNGVEIYRGEMVVEVTGKDEVEGVKLKDGKVLPADMVILAAGVNPNIDLAEEAGIEYDQREGILVDEYMRTSNNDIFACGDCAEKPSFFGQNFAAARLASIATNEGRVAGANLYELRREKQASIGIFSTIVDGLALGVAGLTKKQAEEAGIKIVSGSVAAVNRHPGSMPGAAELGVSLFFREYDGVIVGAQAYGGDSVGEFMNILGLAIGKEMTAEDLALLQVGTHPALTASPVAYQLVSAAEEAVVKMKK